MTRGYIDANVTIIVVNPSSIRSDATISYMTIEQHCGGSNCINELAGTHQIIQYGPGMIAGINFRTSAWQYRGTLYGTGVPSKCFYGLADEITYTFKNPPEGWNEPTVLAHANDIRSMVRCAPAPIQPPPPNYDTSGGNPDGGKGDTPIVIDLGRDGYRFTSPSAGVEFDLRNSGQPVQTAWTRADAENAFLAFDRNGNGHIDSGAELFGNHTPLASGALASNGFTALSGLDENGDGAIDQTDAAWANLLLWTDRNHDGVSDAMELQPLALSVIAALETDYQVVGKRDQSGNLFRYVARYRDVQGQQRQYYDVFLRTTD